MPGYESLVAAGVSSLTSTGADGAWASVPRLSCGVRRLIQTSCRTLEFGKPIHEASGSVSGVHRGVQETEQAPSSRSRPSAEFRGHAAFSSQHDCHARTSWLDPAKAGPGPVDRGVGAGQRCSAAGLKRSRWTPHHRVTAKRCSMACADSWRRPGRSPAFGELPFWARSRQPKPIQRTSTYSSSWLTIPTSQGCRSVRDVCRGTRRVSIEVPMYFLLTSRVCTSAERVIGRIAARVFARPAMAALRSAALSSRRSGGNSLERERRSDAAGHHLAGRRAANRIATGR